MAARIQLLSSLVVNQIAAGEVVERPASILKELLENSIDANSSMIRVYIEQGGISLIKVVDNGSGIHPEDLDLALTQHATSKLQNTEDLLEINSLGFRGEALASISAIAKVKILSQNYAPTGTTVEVKDIFYNLPARKKFLRSNNTEYNYLQEIFKRIALSKFNIGFMLYNNHKLIKNLAPISGDIADHVTIKEQRLKQLLGNKFIENARFFDSFINNIRLCGWLCPKVVVAGNSVQYFYINDRVVKDKLLNMAIRQAMDPGGFGYGYCLYLYLDPKYLDVNVHPTKQEVRFSDPKLIYAFVQESVTEALNKYQNKFENLSKIEDSYNDNDNDNDNDNVELTQQNSFGKDKIDANSKELVNDADLYNKFMQTKWRDTLLHTFERPEPIVSTKELAKDHLELHYSFSDKIYAIFNNKYLIIETGVDKSEILILEVIRSVKWLISNKLNKQNELVDTLLIPERIKSNWLVSINIEDLNVSLQLIHSLNFRINQIHDNTLLISGVPSVLNLFDLKVDYCRWIESIIQQKLYKIADLGTVQAKLITLLLDNMTMPNLMFYGKKDFIKLLEELRKERFNFFTLSEQNLNILILG